MNNEAPWDQILHIAKNTPSGGNTQPWAVYQNKNSINVTTDLSSLENASAFEEMAAFVSIGALSYNIEQAGRGLGYKITFKVINNETPFIAMQHSEYDKNLVAPELLLVINKRCTNRKKSIANIPLSIIDQLHRDFYQFVKNEQAPFLKINMTREPQLIKKIANIIAEMDVLRFSNLITKKRLFEELKCKEGDAPDKVCIDSLEVPWPLEKMLCLMVSVPFFQKFILSSLIRQMVKKQLSSSSDLGCLFSDKDLNKQDLIKVGRVLQAFWLKVTEYGYYIQPWTILSFVALEKRMHNTSIFFAEEQDKIEGLIHEFSNCFEASADIPLFIFRTLDAPKPQCCSTKQEISLRCS